MPMKAPTTQFTPGLSSFYISIITEILSMSPQSEFLDSTLSGTGISR